MNDYKAALSDIMCNVPYGKLKEQEKLLKELVRKATPKKTIMQDKTPYHEFCSVCGGLVFESHNYCCKCGQALDCSE